MTDFSPDNNALNVGVTDNLVITFGENVVFGSGDITIMTSDDSTAEAISVTGGKVTGSGSKTITIDPGIVLTGSTQYYVLPEALLPSLLDRASILTHPSLDNPEQDFNTRNNINIGYDLSLNPGFNFSSSYQGDFQYCNSSVNKDQSSNRILLSMKKKFVESTLDTSLSFGETREPELSDSFDQIQLFGSWTKPIGIYNLTPSAQWTQQYTLNGIYSSSVDIRLTLDRQFHPDLARSKVALYYLRSEDGDTTPPFLTNIGLEATVYMRLWHDSTLYITGSCAKWIREDSVFSDGWNSRLSLSWKMVF